MMFLCDIEVLTFTQKFFLHVENALHVENDYV